MRVTLLCVLQETNTIALNQREDNLYYGYPIYFTLINVVKYLQTYYKEKEKTKTSKSQAEIKITINSPSTSSLLARFKLLKIRVVLLHILGV